jgi:membrane-associated phospholipid phosphatase
MKAMLRDPETRGDEAKAIKALLPLDWLVLGLNSFFAACSFLQTGKSPTAVFGMALDREALMGTTFLLALPAELLLLRLLSPRKNALAAFARLFYPQAFMPLWFSESIILSQLFFGGASLDRYFADLDQLVFGFQPAIEFHRALGGPFAAELFFFAYFFYYVLIVGGPWISFFRGERDRAARALFIILSSFGLLFVWYVFFPVQGPKYYFPELRDAWYSNFKGYFFTSLMKGIFGSMNLGGSAFPSSHVAISLIALILNARDNPKALPAAVPMTALLFFSTVYIYAHYAVDVLGGIAAGLALYAAASALWERLSARAKGDLACAAAATLVESKRTGDGSATNV